MAYSDAELSTIGRDELLTTWQSRVLRGMRAKGFPMGFLIFTPIGQIMLSIVAHNFPDSYARILAETFYDYLGEIHAPFICSIAKIDKGGRVVADYIPKDGERHTDYLIFPSTEKMRDSLRWAADKLLHLTDEDREDMFEAARKWCAADQRLDPTMDPQDPDAKRLAVH